MKINYIFCIFKVRNCLKVFRFYFEILEKTEYFDMSFISYSVSLQLILNEIVEETFFVLFYETREFCFEFLNLFWKL